MLDWQGASLKEAMRLHTPTCALMSRIVTLQPLQPLRLRLLRGKVALRTTRPMPSSAT